MWPPYSFDLFYTRKHIRTLSAHTRISFAHATLSQHIRRKDALAHFSIDFRVIGKMESISYCSNDFCFSFFGYFGQTYYIW